MARSLPQACPVDNRFDKARNYDNNSSEQKEDGFNLMDLLCLEEGNKVLDIGCGTGYLTKELAKRVGQNGRVVGIDPDTERLRVAREKYSVPNVVFQEGRAQDVPGSQYDTVFSNSVLHWCEDKDTIFKQVSRSLKKGGKFGFVTSTNFNVVEQFCTPVDMVSDECRQIFIKETHCPSTVELHNLISDSDFQIAHMQEHTREWRFEGVSKLIEFFMTHHKNLGRDHFNAEAMKRHYGENEIVFKMQYTTAVLVK